MSEYDLITFDCYGTLVDWRGGISTACIEAAARDGVTLERDAVLAIHAEVEPRVQAEGYRSYREVLEAVALGIADASGWKLDPHRADFLPDSLAGWPPFADTNPALRRLVDAGCSLGILSNIDDDLLAGTLRHLNVEFELRITAEQLRSYKPAPAHFNAARERAGERRWLHAAQSWFHDIRPACDLEIPAAWVNRLDEPQPEGHTAVMVCRDLAGLAEKLLGPA